jgi:hypothetical protein
MSANDKQVGGQHYKDVSIEPWDYIIANNIPFLEGNIIKYLTRWRTKGGFADLQKASHYLEKLIEQNEIHKIDTVPKYPGPDKYVTGIRMDIK